MTLAKLILSIIVTLVVLSTEDALAQPDHKNERIIQPTNKIIGLAFGLGHLPSLKNYAIEYGFSDHDSTNSGLAYTFEAGSLKNSNIAPLSYRYSFGIVENRTFSSKEYNRDADVLFAANLGHFFEDGLGLFVSGGVRFGPRLMLASSPQFSGHYWEESSYFGFQPVFGGDIRYRFANGLGPRLGYQYNRGFFLAINQTDFLPRVLRSPYARNENYQRFPYISIGTSYNKASSAWGVHLEQGVLLRDTLDHSGWGYGVDMGAQFYDRNTPPLRDPMYISGPYIRAEYQPEYEVLGVLNVGYYFSNGIGVFPGIGLSYGNNQTIVRGENSSMGHVESTRTVLHFLYGLQLRYMTGDIQFQTGYQAHRGALFSIAYRNFLVDWIIGSRFDDSE